MEEKEEEKPLGTIQPNVKKVFLLDLGKILLIGIIIISLYLYIDNLVNIKGTVDTISESLAYLAPMPEFNLKFWVILAIVIVVLVILFIDYFNLAKLQYIFYKDKLKVVKSVFFITTRDQEIPYNNITRVTSEKGALNTGKVDLELSGLKEKAITLDFIDNVQQAVANIQYLLQQYHTQMNYQMYHQKKIDNTLNLI